MLERESDPEREGERERGTYIHIWGLTMCPTFWHTRDVSPTRHYERHPQQHPRITTNRQKEREGERERESRSAVLSWAAPLAHEGQRQHSHEHESKKEKPTQQSRRTGADAAEARLARHGTHWRRTRTLAETSLFSCSWIVKGLGRVTYTVRKVAKTEQSVLSSSDWHNQN